MKKWIKRHLRKFSFFATACALVAVGYVGYRVYLVAGPKGIQGVWTSRQVASAATIGCNQDDAGLVKPTAAPVITPGYQKVVQNAKHLSKNLVQNPTLEVDENDNPVAFYRITSKPTTDYALLEDPSDNKPFLRAVNSETTTEGETAGGWIMDMVPVKKGHSYAYSFEYRSTVPVSITLETKKADGTMQYQLFTKLGKENNWKRFTAHFHNSEGATEFRFVVASNEAGRVDTKAYDIHEIKKETLDRGIVSITFDDGWQSVADKAIPMLDDYGYDTTQYIVTDAATKNVGEYMDLDTIRKLKEDGHEIASHTTKHCDLTQLSSDSVDRQAHESKTILEEAGLGPIKSLAYPYGQYDERVDAITSKYYPLMRSSEDGYNGRYFDNRNIRSMAVHSTTTEKEFQSWVDYAERHKLWLVITYHRVDEQGDYSVTSKQLTQQLDIIKNSSLKVLPLAKAADTIRAD